jgi:hypothetical protein
VRAVVIEEEDLGVTAEMERLHVSPQPHQPITLSKKFEVVAYEAVENTTTIKVEL